MFIRKLISEAPVFPHKDPSIFHSWAKTDRSFWVKYSISLQIQEPNFQWPHYYLWVTLGGMCFIPWGKCHTKWDIRRQSIGTSSKDIILQCDQKGRCQKYLLITPKMFEPQKYITYFWISENWTFLGAVAPLGLAMSVGQHF